MAQYHPPLSATVLIVENEAIIRIELAAQLVDMGLRVLVACDADEAITLLDAHGEISLLLTDVLMPGSMDGVRLAYHVRDRWPPIKIVAMSGRPGLGAGDLPSGSTFFPKPYSAATVGQAVALLLKGGALRAA